MFNLRELLHREMAGGQSNPFKNSEKDDSANARLS